MSLVCIHARTYNSYACMHVTSTRTHAHCTNMRARMLHACTDTHTRARVHGCTCVPRCANDVSCCDAFVWCDMLHCVALCCTVLHFNTLCARLCGLPWLFCKRVCACVHVCVRACVRVYVCARTRVRVCVHVCMCCIIVFVVLVYVRLCGLE